MKLRRYEHREMYRIPSMAAVQTTGVVMMYQYVRCCSHSDACCMWKIESTSKLGEGTTVFDLLSSSCVTASGDICSSSGN
jgi:hypothetical protein